MSEKNDIFKAIATLGRAIADLELTIYCKNEEIKRLKEENERLKGEKNENISSLRRKPSGND